MKTIFLNKLKQGLFLLIAVLGTFISYSQPTQTTTIGGSKTPDPVCIFDIGGKPKPEPIPFNLTCETQSAIINLNVFDEPSDVGRVHGKIPPFRLVFEIGGRSTDPSPIVKKVAIGGKQNPEPPLFTGENSFDTGSGDFLPKPPLPLPVAIALPFTV